MTTPSGQQYTLEQAEADIADLRGLVNVLSEAHAKDSTDLTPNTPASTGTVAYSAAGQEKYVSSDGNAYNTGRLSLRCTSTQSLTTSFATISGLSVPLGVGIYRVVCKLLVNPSSGGGTPSYQYNGSGGLALSNGRLSCQEIAAGATSGTVWISDFGGTSGALPTSFTSGGALGSTNNRIVLLDGWLEVSTAGTLNIQAKLTSGAAAIVQFGTYLDIMPVS